MGTHQQITRRQSEVTQAQKKSRSRVNLRSGIVRVTTVNPELRHCNESYRLVDDKPTYPTTFAQWYAREFHDVVGLLLVLSGSRTAAEELAQEAFIAAHRKWKTIQHYDDPGAWVRRVAINRARSWGRRRSAEARAYAKHVGRARTLPTEMPESADAFWTAVRSLPKRQAQIVALHYFDDRSVDDIADLLEISPGTVKTQLHRARKTLATRLAATLEDE